MQFIPGIKNDAVRNCSSLFTTDRVKTDTIRLQALIQEHWLLRVRRLGKDEGGLELKSLNRVRGRNPGGVKSVYYILKMKENATPLLGNMKSEFSALP